MNKLEVGNIYIEYWHSFKQGCNAFYICSDWLVCLWIRKCICKHHEITHKYPYTVENLVFICISWNMYLSPALRLTSLHMGTSFTSPVWECIFCLIFYFFSNLHILCMHAACTTVHVHMKTHTHNVPMNTQREKIPSWVLQHIIWIIPISQEWCGCLGGNDSVVQWRSTEW